VALLTHWDGEPVQVWARIWKADRVEAHDSLGSTNDRLKELADQGVGPFAVVVADEQTAGRGRSGAAWFSPPGAGLWLSTLIADSRPVPAFLPLLVGLAAARAAEEAVPGLAVGIKWPNDLEIHGRKVGGILCEHVHHHVVAGVGLNVRLPPEGVPDGILARATSLERAGSARVSMGTLATALMHHLRDLTRKPGTQMASDLHEELERRDALRGRQVTTQQAGEGTARGIGRDGAFRLERQGGDVVKVVSGSVRTL
jgi:BirA family biotin operon repressor/biotin-[acetyl-CoA-carboxylase] ligase